VVLVAPPEHGTLQLAADGSFSYPPNPGFYGRDTFRYRAVDAYYVWKEIVTVSGGAMPENFKAAGLPDDIGSVMWDMDFAWSAENRDRILEQWTAEFDN